MSGGLYLLVLLVREGRRGLWAGAGCRRLSERRKHPEHRKLVERRQPVTFAKVTG
ncbi:hypothetical protein SAMN05428941_2968 [Streptomyces sp. 2114.2]|nr:hypothetical protein BX268_2976 [Streptomyces sp. 2221.1]BDD72354.1 hypothetical protein JCM4020_29740 [Streptomyces coelicolor]SDT46355.1 hypothetical protein SAMN05428941_2968 [Streptomyces sp. 2114.2]